MWEILITQTQKWYPSFPWTFSGSKLYHTKLYLTSRKKPGIYGLLCSQEEEKKLWRLAGSLYRIHFIQQYCSSMRKMMQEDTSYRQCGKLFQNLQCCQSIFSCQFPELSCAQAQLCNDSDVIPSFYHNRLLINFSGSQCSDVHCTNVPKQK